MQYISDIEGHKHFFDKQLTDSDVLIRDKNGSLDFTDDTGMFVFGGDVCDRGDDITIMQMLLDFKKKYPDRVFLITGNRDINKTRFLTELPKQATDNLLNIVDAVEKPVFARKHYKDFLGHNMDCPINRLKWILTETMGAPAAFECRRAELAKLQQVQHVSDEDVYQSFRDSIEREGIMREYLECAQVALVLGDTLFVHGSINENNIKKVPVIGKSSEITADYQTYEDVTAWVEALNQWYRENLQRCFANAETECCHSFSRTISGAALQEYAAGPGSRYKGCSVIVGNMFGGKNSVLSPMSIGAAKWLTLNGVHRVALGHQPHGQTPGYVIGTFNGITNDGYNNIEYITADTLYGNALAYDEQQGAQIRASDPRGCSYAQVYIEYERTKKLSQVSVLGVDGNGQHYAQNLENRFVGGNRTKPDSFIGRVYADEHGNHFLVRVNSKPEDGLYKVSSKALPYTIVYQEKTRKELQAILAADQFIGKDRRGLAESNSVASSMRSLGLLSGKHQGRETLEQHETAQSNIRRCQQ